MGGCKDRLGRRETHHSDKGGQSGEDTGLLHYAGVGVREDQGGVSEGCAGVRAVIDAFSKNGNIAETLELMDLIQRDPRIFEIFKAAATAQGG